MAKVRIYKRFERFWHWMQALLVTLLVITGFEVHGSYKLMGFEDAVMLHNISAYILMVLVIFAAFWHFTTGEWRQYIPTTQYMQEMIKFYISGIFKGENHPGHKTEVSKLNPLQRLTYLGLKLFLFPVQIGTGLAYLLYNEWAAENGISLETIAYLHIIGAFAFLIFLVVHMYLTTTGETPSSNIKAMVTGWEELPEHKE